MQIGRTLRPRRIARAGLAGLLAVATPLVLADPAPSATPKWSIVSTPSPGTRNTSFNGVSCPTSTSCFAVGYFTQSPGLRTLIEHWDGRRWSLMSSPNPKGAIQAYLNGALRLTAIALALGIVASFGAVDLRSDATVGRPSSPFA